MKLTSNQYFSGSCFWRVDPLRIFDSLRLRRTNQVPSLAFLSLIDQVFSVSPISGSTASSIARFNRFVAKTTVPRLLANQLWLTETHPVACIPSPSSVRCCSSFTSSIDRQRTSPMRPKQQIFSTWSGPLSRIRAPTYVDEMTLGFPSRKTNKSWAHSTCELSVLGWSSFIPHLDSSLRCLTFFLTCTTPSSSQRSTLFPCTDTKSLTSTARARQTSTLSSLVSHTPSSTPGHSESPLQSQKRCM